MIAAEENSEFFFRLSPTRVLQAVEAAGFVPTGHCFALNALENRVYDVRLEDGQHVVAKFYRPGRWNRETILDEHRLLAALEAAEIPVCVPIAFADGATLDEIEGIHFAIWPRTGGRSPDELRDDQVAVLGRLLARIHDVGAAVTARHRPVLDAEGFPLAALALLENRDFLPPGFAGRYRDAVHALVDIYRERSRGIEHLPIHGDCHLGNLLHGDRGWFFLDFDDMVIGPAVHDIWMLLPGRDDHAERQRALLIDAYREFRPIDEAGLALIEPLRGFRFVWYAGWIAKRWDDPAFPDAFPHFGSEEYWEKETRDLEEQLDLIRGGRSSEHEGAERASPGSDDDAGGERTNADYFWDL
jgi:Ser/Thr protein kinase RdoA (MazF antagonist)